MRKFFYAVIYITLAVVGATSCGDDNNWEEYENWRMANTEWYNQQLNRKNTDGTPYFTVLQPTWYPQSGVLIHYFNDRALTQNNLQPLVTSHVTVKYHGRLYNDIGFDSTTVGADSVRTFSLSEVVTGWKIALTHMHVGDSAEIVIPYEQGYGYSGSGSSVPPYSALKFNIGLKDVPAYVVP